MLKTTEPKMTRTDCSQVPTHEVVAVLKPYVESCRRSAEASPDFSWDLTRWLAPYKDRGLTPDQITRILRFGVPTVNLRLVDLICHAMGEPGMIHSFTFIPGSYPRNARDMAYEEYAAVHDEEAPVEFLERRAQELRSLRERVLSFQSSMRQDG